MRPAPPPGAVFAQLWLSCAEFHDDRVPVVLPPGPSPSVWPTRALMEADADVQSLHVLPGMSVPSAFEPVRMSCSTGAGDPGHCPLMRRPVSSMKSAASPVRACSSSRLRAISTPLALRHGPIPMRVRPSTGGPLSGSRSTLIYARHVCPAPPAVAASCWHSASAPRSPPRLPVVLLALLTKNVIGPVGSDGITLFVAPHPAPSTQRATAAHVFISRVRADRT